MSSPYIESLGVARGAAYKIFKVIDSEPVINASKYNGKRLEKMTGNIRFEDVVFNYPSRNDAKVCPFEFVKIEINRCLRCFKGWILVLKLEKP